MVTVHSRGTLWYMYSHPQIVNGSIYLVVGLRLCLPVGHGAVSVPTATMHSCRTLQYMYGHSQIIYSKAMVNG